MSEQKTGGGTPSILEQITGLAPTELLSGEGAAAMFASFEADHDLGWDRSDLTRELGDHTRRALKWSMVAAAAERYVADLELGVKDLRARLDARSRQTFTAGSVKFTEAMVTASIDSDPTWQEAMRALHEAQAKARVLADVRDLFRHRKDLLVQEALQLRQEGPGGDPAAVLDSRTRRRCLEERGRHATSDQ